MEDLFTNRPPSPHQTEVMDGITAGFLAIAEVIDVLPQSRCKSLAITKLEEASMWAKKCAVFDVPAEPAGAS